MQTLLLAFLLTGTAMADPAPPPRDPKTQQPSAPAPDTNPLAGLSMEQQMALCEKLDTLQKDGKPLSPKMQQQLAACQKMDATMNAPDATMDR